MQILDYFNVNCIWKDNIPKIQLKLKDELKITKIIPIKCIIGHRKIPMSSSQLDFFIHYLGKEIGILVYNERKKLFPKTKLIEWYILNCNPTQPEIDLLIQYKESIGTKIKKSLNDFYKSDKSVKTRELYHMRSNKWKDVIGKQNSDKWKDKEYSEKQIKKRKESGFYEKVAEKCRKRMMDPILKEKFLISMRSEARRNKISVKAKQMWKDAKDNDNEKIKRMLYSGKNKQYDFKGIKMNSIEFLIAQLLDELNIQFIYEKQYTFGSNTFIPDFYLPEYNTIIEVFGDYWHANPKLFNFDKIIFRTPVEEIWKRDKRKQEIFLENGMKYIILWEDEINNNLNEIKKIICKITFMKN